MLVVNDQEYGDQAIETCKTFYDAVPNDPDNGGETMITLMTLVMRIILMPVMTTVIKMALKLMLVVIHMMMVPLTKMMLP